MGISITLIKIEEDLKQELPITELKEAYKEEGQKIRCGESRTHQQRRRHQRKAGQEGFTPTSRLNSLTSPLLISIFFHKDKAAPRQKGLLCITVGSPPKYY